MSRLDSAGETSDAYYELPIGNLLWHVRVAERKMQRAIRNALTSTRVTKAQFGVMQVLAQMHSASPATLARTLTVSRQAMVGVYTSLEAKGYIIRESRSARGRMLTGRMTPKGEEAFARAAERFEEIDQAVDAAFTTREREMLVRLLDKVGDVFEAYEREHPR
jgi:DNA-binding MarR family transcriptional regulator